MKVVIGLGNPGKEYENTRHNVGFMVLDRLADMWHVDISQHKFQSMVGEGRLDTEKVLLVKPLTFMNLSGEAVRKVVDFYKLDIEDLVIVYDDLDLPAGRIRLRQKGSAGGHNGIKSIIAHLGTQEFKRVKIGIDRPPAGQDVARYVLSPFGKEERNLVDEAVDRAARACEHWIRHSFTDAMNQFNG
ncbi:MAG: aminoacyl-tRNA hydrolase [Bacillaceae bacterium]|nr:aminoacyl-tRNA hydrolase [Bacillaceae bacterium]